MRCFFFFNLSFDFFNNVFSIIKYDRDERIIRNSKFCEGDSQGFVIYLNKKPDLNAGTSIYKNIKKLENEEEKHAKKKEFYKLKNMSKLHLKKYKNILLEFNKNDECSDEELLNQYNSAEEFLK